MQTNCPACGAPVTGDAKFCSHCGAKLPDSAQRIEIRSEIRIEDAAKLEEVRLKHALREKELQEKRTAGRSGSRVLKIKRWVSWLLCVLFLCLTVLFFTRDQVRYEGLWLVSFILFAASGIYAVVITFTALIHRFRHRE